MTFPCLVIVAWEQTINHLQVSNVPGKYGDLLNPRWSVPALPVKLFHHTGYLRFVRAGACLVMCAKKAARLSPPSREGRYRAESNGL